MSELEIERWLRIRKAEALKIDPKTAEIAWWHALTLDPYGVYNEFPQVYDQVGREFFARRPGSEIWVHFGDLPNHIREKLWAAVRAGLNANRSR